MSTYNYPFYLSTGWEKNVSLNCIMIAFDLYHLLSLQMFLSIAFAAVGVAGGLYSLIVAALGLQNGPLCKTVLIWTTPFKELTG